MHDTTVHATKGFLIYVAPGYDGAAGDVAAAKSLGESDDVRLEVPVFEAEHFAGATESGLDLIDNEEGAIFATDLLGFYEKIALRILDTFALDRLDDEGGDIAFGQFLFECGQVIHLNAPVEALHERAETFGETLAAHE